MNYTIPKFTFEKKINCMTLFNNAKQANIDSDKAAQDTHLLPHKKQEAAAAAKKYEQLISQFNKDCI
jgi:hypothetical protein